jgi:hypothetical protein
VQLDVTVLQVVLELTVKMDVMARVDVPGLKAIKVVPDPSVQRVLWVLRVLRVLLVQSVQRVQKDQKVKMLLRGYTSLRR